MPLYAYRGINRNGRKVRGEMSATGEAELYAGLKDGGLFLGDCRPREKGAFRLSPGARRISHRDFIQMGLHLEQMLRAGVPLIEALEVARDSTDNRRLHDILVEVVRDVNDGAGLSDAFSRFSNVFGPVFSALVAVGEESGRLQESFSRLVRHYKWQERISGRVRRALRYPIFMIFVMLFLFFFMMTFVVPEVVTFLASVGRDLPMVTRALMATSDFVSGHIVGLLLVPVVLWGLLRGLRRSRIMAYHLDALALHLPVMGGVVRKIALSRFAHFFALMFASGVPILQGLRTARRVVVNRYQAEALRLVEKSVESGDSLSVAMNRWGQFPPLVVRMVRIGEDSGALQETLANVTDFYDREVEETVDRMIALVEPALTICAGALLGWIIFAVIGPLYDSFEMLGR